MFFVEMEGGCLVSLSHSIRPTGYLSKTWHVGGKRVTEYFHRFIYRAHKGELPEGHEVDHICRNRACCNPSHLRAIERSDHMRLTRLQEHEEAHEAARLAWEAHDRPGASELARMLERSPRTIATWVADWLAETDDWKAEYAARYLGHENERNQAFQNVL